MFVLYTVTRSCDFCVSTQGAPKFVASFEKQAIMRTFLNSDLCELYKVAIDWFPVCVNVHYKKIIYSKPIKVFEIVHFSDYINATSPMRKHNFSYKNTIIGRYFGIASNLAYYVRCGPLFHLKYIQERYEFGVILKDAYVYL